MGKLRLWLGNGCTKAIETAGLPDYQSRIWSFAGFVATGLRSRHVFTWNVHLRVKVPNGDWMQTIVRASRLRMLLLPPCHGIPGPSWMW
nr:hypothetical protein [Acaryochloris sp. CCMEE 5410]